ncbi:transposase [Ostertagia ostertagi]
MASKAILILQTPMPSAARVTKSPAPPLSAAAMASSCAFLGCALPSADWAAWPRSLAVYPSAAEDMSKYVLKAMPQCRRVLPQHVATLAMPYCRKYRKSQIVAAIKKQESGVPVKEISRELGINQATFYNWKAKYGGMECGRNRFFDKI